MYSRCLSLLILQASFIFAADTRVLRVCADPNNMPFSSKAADGLENRMAELVAHDLGARLEYTWWSERKSFLQNSLIAGVCDVVMGVPSSLTSVTTTKPYYNSTYVFVSRLGKTPPIDSLFDERLAGMRIGIHVVGDDFAPPAHILARRGLSKEIVPYSLFGKFGEPNPPSRLIEAVANQDVDLAIVWGPFAGYFARRQNIELVVSPVHPAAFMGIPLTYEISMAVRKGDNSLLEELDAVLVRQCQSIAGLLDQFGIPQVSEDKTRCASSHSASAFLH